MQVDPQSITVKWMETKGDNQSYSVLYCMLSNMVTTIVKYKQFAGNGLKHANVPERSLNLRKENLKKKYRKKEDGSQSVY